MINTIIVEEEDVNVRTHGFNAVITHPDLGIQIIVQRQAIDSLVKGLVEVKNAYTDEYIDSYYRKMGA